jgi:hypothetical protein
LILPGSILCQFFLFSLPGIAAPYMSFCFP